MKIVDVEQNTDEWDKLRELRIGASNAQAIAANGKGLETLVRGKMKSYYSSGEEERYYSKAMEHGHEQESTAAMLYEFKTGRKTHKVGYVIHSEHIGISPDRGVGDDGLLEIKCPADKVYFDLLLDGKIDTKYDWQMQMQMLVFGKSWCDYAVYNPNFEQELVIMRVLPDSKKFDKLLKGFDSATKRIVEIMELMGRC